MVTVAFLERGVLLSGVGCPQCQDAVAAAAAGLPNEAPETNDDEEDVVTGGAGQDHTCPPRELRGRARAPSQRLQMLPVGIR